MHSRLERAAASQSKLDVLSDEALAAHGERKAKKKTAIETSARPRQGESRWSRWAAAEDRAGVMKVALQPNGERTE